MENTITLPKNKIRDTTDMTLRLGVLFESLRFVSQNMEEHGDIVSLMHLLSDSADQLLDEILEFDTKGGFTNDNSEFTAANISTDSVIPTSSVDNIEDYIIQLESAVSCAECVIRDLNDNFFVYKMGFHEKKQL